MRKSKTQSIGPVLREYIEALGHKRKLQEVNVVNQWENLMGKPIARRTTEIFIRKKILYVTIDSPVIRQELMMMRESIRARMNEMAGDELVVKIVLR